MVDNRIHQILDAIVRDPNLTGSELELQFGLTRKQLSYTMKKINDFLETHNFAPIRRYKTGKLAVPTNVIHSFRCHKQPVEHSRYIYSEEERTQLIIFLLLTRNERLSLLHLASSLGVSQNTVINDIKKIHGSIVQQNLHINYDRGNGYRIIGSEIGKRHILLQIIRKIITLPVANRVFADYGNITTGRLEQVGHVFSEIEKRLKILFTDEQLQELTYFICCVLQRIESGKVVDNLPESYAEAADSRDFQLMQKLIEKFGIYDRNEQIFLTVLVQSSNIQTIADKYFLLDAMLLESVVDVVENLEQISCIDFNDKNELIERIYQHWKPAYYRTRYHISNNNSVYDIVLKEFGHLHEIVRRAIGPFEQLLHCKMPDEEVAFITVLFGGWLTREGTINQIKSKKIAIVVCENSATVSTYFYLTLQVLFPELHFSTAMSKREFEKYNRYYDIVFATGPIDTDKMLFIVNPTLNHVQKNSFRSQVIGALQGVDPTLIQVEALMQIIEQHSQIADRKALQKALSNYLYHDESAHQTSQIFQQEVPSLTDLLPLEHIHIGLTADISWQNAIALAAGPLLNKALVEPYYVERMIDIIQVNQPYIMLADGLIIAHAGIDDGVNAVSMALLTLPKRIDIGGYMQADLIIVLATNNPQKQLKALAQLNDFLEFHDGAMRIRAAHTAAEIYQLFSHYL